MNRWSLYLEYYPPVLYLKTEKRLRKEYLGIYIYEYELSDLHRMHNQEMLAKAEDIKEQRILAIERNDGFLVNIKDEAKVDILDCFYRAALKKDYRWMITYKHFKNYVDGTPYYKEDITPEFIEGFRRYLAKTNQLKYKHKKLSLSSINSYYSIFKIFSRQQS